MSKVYIILGSNIGDKKEQLKNAISKIKENVGDLISSSSIYSTSPWGFESQDYFLNQVICVESRMEYDNIMTSLLDIENELGRKRNRALEGYESRSIDIDVLLIDEVVYRSDILIVPHPRMSERRFVLEPLCEIAPKLMHPLSGKNVEELLLICSDNEKVFKLND